MNVFSSYSQYVGKIVSIQDSIMTCDEPYLNCFIGELVCNHINEKVIFFYTYIAFSSPIFWGFLFFFQFFGIIIVRTKIKHVTTSLLVSGIFFNSWSMRKKWKHRYLFCKRFYGIAFRDHKRHEIFVTKYSYVNGLSHVINDRCYYSSGFNFLDTRYQNKILCNEEKQEVINIAVKERLQEDIDSTDQKEFFHVVLENKNHYLFYLTDTKELTFNPMESRFTSCISFWGVYKCFVIHNKRKYYYYIVPYIDGNLVHRKWIQETDEIRTYECEPVTTMNIVFPPFEMCNKSFPLLKKRDYSRIIDQIEDVGFDKIKRLKSRIEPIFYEHYYIYDRERCKYDEIIKQQLREQNIDFRIY